MQLFNDDRERRQIAIWSAFCAKNRQRFTDLFPAFFSEKEAHEDWYERLFIYGDEHFSVGGMGFCPASLRSICFEGLNRPGFQRSSSEWGK